MFKKVYYFSNNGRCDQSVIKFDFTRTCLYIFVFELGMAKSNKYDVSLLEQVRSIFVDRKVHSMFIRTYTIQNYKQLYEVLYIHLIL